MEGRGVRLNTTTAGKPPRVLIVRVGAMGDVVHAMPAVAALRAVMPAADIGWVIEPRWAPLLRADGYAVPLSDGMPLVNRIHEAPTRLWSREPLSRETLRSILHLRRELRSQRYDIAVDLQGSLRSAVIARMSGAGRIVGADRPREMPARFLYREHVAAKQAHVVDQAAEMLSAAADRALQPILPPLPQSAAMASWCDALLAGANGPHVLIAPTAGWGAKEWPAVRFGAVAAELARRGCAVFVNATGKADATANLVAVASQARAQPVICSVAQLCALVQKMDLVIGGDTGPVHLAAAAGVATVALFGPTDPIRNGPWDRQGGLRTRILRHPASCNSYRHVAGEDAGLLRISVEDVVAAAAELIALRA